MLPIITCKRYEEKYADSSVAGRSRILDDDIFNDLRRFIGSGDESMGFRFYRIGENAARQIQSDPLCKMATRLYWNIGEKFTDSKISEERPMPP